MENTQNNVKMRRIIWRKPEGHIRISRRSGVVLQHSYPMYFYPDNLQETILIFQKGRFGYSYIKQLSPIVKRDSKINLKQFNEEKWNLTVWKIVNVLPKPGRLEDGIATFPEEIPRRLIKLFTFNGEIILDPFLGSGTTAKVAKELRRHSYGYELELKSVILEKIGYSPHPLTDDLIDIVEHEDAERLNLPWKKDSKANICHKKGKRAISF